MCVCVCDGLVDEGDGKCAVKKLTRLIQQKPHVEKLGDLFMNKLHKWLVKPWLP